MRCNELPKDKKQKQNKKPVTEYTCTLKQLFLGSSYDAGKASQVVSWGVRI